MYTAIYFFYILVLFVATSGYPFDQGIFTEKLRTKRSAEQEFEENFDNQEDNPMAITGANNNKICDDTTEVCMPIKNYKISRDNTFNCMEDTILITFEKNVNGELVKKIGYLMPYTLMKDVLKKPKYSKNCRFIKR